MGRFCGRVPADNNFRSLCMHAQSLSHIQLFCDPMDLACQAPLSMGFPRQAYWGGLPISFSKGSSDSGIEPETPALAGRY